MAFNDRSDGGSLTDLRQETKLLNQPSQCLHLPLDMVTILLVCDRDF